MIVVLVGLRNEPPYVDQDLEGKNQTEQTNEGSEDGVQNDGVPAVGVDGHDDCEVHDGSPQDMHYFFVELGSRSVFTHILLVITLGAINSINTYPILSSPTLTSFCFC